MFVDSESGSGPSTGFIVFPQEKSPEQQRRICTMVEGAKADRRRPPSSDRALLARLLMGKGGMGRPPSEHEGKRAPGLSCSETVPEKREERTLVC